LPGNWSFAPHEAFDMILFINAISDNPFYNEHYLDVRQNWLPKLGQDFKILNEICEKISMSNLCSILSMYDVKTIDDITIVLQDYAKHENGASVISDNLEILSEGFRILKQAEVQVTWNQRVKPYLSNISEQYQMVMGSVFPLEQIDATISSFLAAEQPLCSTVYFATYIKPIAFKLTKGAMVMHAGPHGYMQLPRRLAQLCLHESLHGFSGSSQAQLRQDELRKSNERFNTEYNTLITTYHSGPEEYFVVGAEAYLSEKLMLRTRDDCIEYLKNQNGGMRLSFAIYERLKETNPENNDAWEGYGKWLEAELLSLKI